jgi:hypothetical protein
MKKIAISLFALAAVSSAAFANDNRGYDPRDSDGYLGQYSNQTANDSTSTSAIAVMGAGQAVTSFERMKWQSEENDNGGRD